MIQVGWWILQEIWYVTMTNVLINDEYAFIQGPHGYIGERNFVDEGPQVGNLLRVLA